MCLLTAASYKELDESYGKQIYRCNLSLFEQHCHNSFENFLLMIFFKWFFRKKLIQSMRGRSFINLDCALWVGGWGEARPALAVVQRMGDAWEPQQQATVTGPPPQKINLISRGPMVHISDIKLIRTDTTLDLSQKAEKGMPSIPLQFAFYRPLSLASCLSTAMWDYNIACTFGFLSLSLPNETTNKFSSMSFFLSTKWEISRSDSLRW